MWRVMLNIVYSTSRKEPRLEWFLSSLANECAGDFSTLNIIIVDYWANPFGGTKQSHESRRDYVTDRIDAAGIPHEAFNWVSPKSTPWQGKQRQTQEDWFNVANSRNTGLCFCADGWVLFSDDLSVLTPGFLGFAAQAAMNDKIVTLCRYRKVRELLVEKGNIVSFKPCHITDEGRDTGEDSRQSKAGYLERPKTDCPDDWHYGYVLGPVQAYLEVNGWVETETAGLSYEDVPTGINLRKKGYGFRYDPRMLVLESEEGHDQGPGMKRADYQGKQWNRPQKDKSHAVLQNARSGDGWAKNDFFNGMTLSQLRDHVYAKASNPFPAPKPNAVEWFTGTPLHNLHSIPY